MLRNNIRNIMILMILLSFSSAIPTGNAQMTNLSIEVSTTTLNAGSNNDVILALYNDFAPIYELIVSMYFTASTQGSSAPTIVGVHSWKFDKLAVGDSVEIPVIIFVPEDAAGNAYTANVVLTYKRLGYVSSITEDDTIGFYVEEEEEWIDMVFYEVEVDPDPAQPGASITFSANILNKGNIPAMYTNVSLVENDVLNLQSESYSYLGQIDPNSPATFDLEASVKPRTKKGSYTVEIRISYEDEDNVPYSVSRQISFNVIELERMREPPQGPLESILGPIRELFFPSPPQGPSQPPSQRPSQPGSIRGSNTILSFISLFILIAVIIGVVVFVRRRWSKKNEFEEAFEEEFEKE